MPATKPDVIALLKLHEIEFETIDAPRTMKLDMVRLADPKLGKPGEGHIPLTASYRHATRAETYPAGSVRVSSDQPLGLLAAAMLERESPDSLLAWNFYPEILMRTEYIEGYVIAPLADRMLASDPALKVEFEAKLAAHPKFAADPAARLGWFYERPPITTTTTCSTRSVANSSDEVRVMRHSARLRRAAHVPVIRTIEARREPKQFYF